MTAVACIASFLVGMAFMRFLAWLDAASPAADPEQYWDER